MGSSRLPGKTLEPLGDATVLDWVVRRLAFAESVDEVVVATSTRPDDDAIEDHLAGTGVSVVRGDADDVLGRFISALSATDAEIVLRVTADCPFVDPSLVDRAVASLGSLDYVATGVDGRFPRGFDLEAMTRAALVAADSAATEPDEREHVTLHIVRYPTRFAIGPIVAPGWIVSARDIRVTVDEAEDLEVVRAVVAGTGLGPEDLTGEIVVEFLHANPSVRSVNAAVEHRTIS